MNIPEGWKLVPVEPTKEMYAQFLGYDGTQYTNAFDKEHFIEDWERMLAAAPTAPPQKDEPVAELVAHTERKHALIKITKRSTTYLALGTPLYTHPDNSELRISVEEAIGIINDAIERLDDVPCRIVMRLHDAVENLRVALEAT